MAISVLGPIANDWKPQTGFMDTPRMLVWSALAGAAKGVIIFALLVLFNAGGIKTMLLQTSDTYFVYAVGAVGLSSLTAVIEVVIAVGLAAIKED